MAYKNQERGGMSRTSFVVRTIKGLLGTCSFHDGSVLRRSVFIAKATLVFSFLALALAILTLAIFALALTFVFSRHPHTDGTATVFRLVEFQGFLNRLFVFVLYEADASR